MSGRTLVGIVAPVLIGVLVAAAASDGGDQAGGVPVFVICAAWALALNWAAFVPSFLARTEHYYDLTGSLTYVTTTLLALALADELDVRTVILAALVLVWSVRLGTFLFRRVRRAGSDARFDKIKHDWGRFLVAWTIQALWVVFTAAAAWAAMTSGDKTAFGVFGVVGLIVWLLGFGTEVLADRQKNAFRADPDNAGRFITSGLWARSRHPNYVGEFVLWVGVAIIALPVLHGWQFVTVLSPVFVYLLLTRVSGVPLLEARADERWGGEPEYEAYKRDTPVFLPIRIGRG